MATTIGERIRAAREAKGLSQAELARRLGIRGPSLNNLESGESGKPSAETLLRMRDEGINPDYIMRGRGPKLLEAIERKLENETLMSMIDELDAAGRQAVLTMVKALRRNSGKPSGNDPFGFDPPEGGTQ